MERFAQLGADIVKLWAQCGGDYLSGIQNTIILALVATAIGCNHRPDLRHPQHHPLRQERPARQALLRQADPGDRPDLRGGVPGHAHDASGGVHLLRPALLHRQRGSSGPACGRAAILVVSVNTGAYMAESVRGGIISIDPGQTEGAKAIGMTHVQTMTSVILPQAIRNIMPQIGNNFIINIKDSSVMFIISFTEFFAAHRGAVGATYLYFPSATIEMAGYLTMTLIASFLLRLVEKRMDGSSDYELVQDDALTMTAGTYSHPDRGTPFDERSAALDAEARERKRQELKYGRPKGDR